MRYSATASNSKMLQVLPIFIFLAGGVGSQVIHPDCPEKCGDVTIPYPFGIGRSCALNDKFTIFCNRSLSPPSPFLDRTNILPIIDIFLNGTLRKYTSVARDCYDLRGKPDRGHSYPAESQILKFYYSATQNKFTVVGCDTYAILHGSANNNRYASGCISVCFNKSSLIDGTCSGIGCCQSSIPKELNKFNAILQSYNNHTLVWSFNPCSSAFIADENYYNFSTKSLIEMPSKVPTVLDWAVGDQNCKEAEKNESYACKENSICQDSSNGPGYLCFCSSGFRGNPYIQGGCKDIDECKEKTNDCTHKCHNTEGSFTCSCPKWFHGDGKRNGTGCTFLDQDNIIDIMIGIGIFLLVLSSGSYLLYRYRRKQIHKKRKETFFKQNGGTILLDRMSKEDSSINTIKIFKAEELEEATDNFNESTVCGRGGFGTVYRGILSDGTVVAIKKSKIMDPRQTEQFINEIAIVSQIQHQNVVRLLGCCFETPDPLLVYEYISNGTLSSHIHNNNNNPKMPWDVRLKIAAETAGVLAYLHSAHSPPIIHRDIKPANILLDENYSAKVSDFGCSKLTPKNEVEMCTMVQGTLGYLDPEYLQTGQLTEKSDVYSFGVVLIELLTGLRAVCFERTEVDWSLVSYFLSFANKNNLSEILDKGIMNNDNMKEMVEMGKIAKSCVVVKGEERPRMKEVAKKLEHILGRRKVKQERESLKKEENESFHGESGESQSGVSVQTAGDSGARQSFLAININSGR